MDQLPFAAPSLNEPQADAAQRSLWSHETTVASPHPHQSFAAVAASAASLADHAALALNAAGAQLAFAGAPSAAAAAPLALASQLAHGGTLQAGLLPQGAGFVAAAGGGGGNGEEAQQGNGKRRRGNPEYKAKQNEAAVARRQEKKQRTVALQEENSRLQRLVAAQTAQIGALQPASQQQQIEAAVRARGKAERGEQHAREGWAAAQASSSRLADALRVKRAAAATAPGDARRAMQDARDLRAEIECMKLELSKAVDEAVARTVHESELEQRRLIMGHEQRLETLRASEAEARKRAIAAGARADEAGASVAAADVCAKASRKELRQHAQQILLLKHRAAGAAAAAAEDSARRFAAMEASDSDFDSGAGAAGGGGGGGGRGGGGGGGSRAEDEGCGAWEGDGDESGGLNLPGGSKRVTAKPARTLRTDEEKIRSMRAATSGASYSQIEELAASSPELLRICQKRNLQRAADDARIAGLLMHGIELCRAVKRISIKADGFSMHTKDGLHEFVTYTHSLKDARGKLLDLPLDGFLISQGLTAADEAALCDRCLAFLKAAVCVLRKKYEELFGADSCPLWLHEDRIDLASFSHVGADGANAAQAWARLMKERVQVATKARIGARWDKLSAIEQARELHVEATNCCIHGGVLGFTWASKAAAKLTASLSASAVASVRETRHASDHFAHACNLKAALHCGGKLLGCVNGYAFGKAHYFLIVFQRPQYAHLEYIAWPRQNGSRFFWMIRMCAVFLRTREVALEALGNLMIAPTLSKIVSSYWSQVNSPLLMMEARVSEAMMAALGEPTQVLLGQGAFGSGGGDGDGSGGWKSILDSELLELLDGSGQGGSAAAVSAVGADGGGAAPGQAAAKRVASLKASAAPFVTWHSGASDRSLKGYRAEVLPGTRAAVAEAFRDASLAEVSAVLGACAGGCDDALALVDGGEYAEPDAGACGMWETVDVLSGLTRAARAFAEQPALVFDGRRPSSRLREFLPAYAIEKLEEWESAVYKRPARNASFVVIGASARAVADAWRKEPPQLCAKLEAGGTRDR